MFNSVAGHFNSWFGESEAEENKEKLESEESQPTNEEKKEMEEHKEHTKAEIAWSATDGQLPDQAEGDFTKNIDELGAKAVTTAKEWGNWLYGMGKTAGEELVKSAKTLKTTVEDKTIVGEFHKEQQKFIETKKEHKAKSEAGVPPWVGYNEEEEMKNQILNLAKDKRNFLRNPPAGVQFKFDFESAYPVAMATLAEDNSLEKMRFELVPKQIKEEVFWRNYFYRVSLIKQSAQLTTLAQQTGETTDKGQAVDKGQAKLKESSPTTPGLSSEAAETELDLPVGTPPDHEFVSDAYQTDFNTDELKRGLQELGVGEKQEGEIADWEKELQAELQEYEVVDDDNDEDLEEELMKQIEAETK